MVMFGLTNEENKAWCKNKADYIPLIRKQNRTDKESATLRRMAEEYRDWHRRNKMEKKNRGGDYSKVFNPKLHTSKIFSDIPGYTGGEK